ncbi:MAG: M48 family metallopeptidase [Zoogloea sp.]|uniref:M48 family metallopeptidase n=1 Tax=Zoogloea sp. TaxID=49181 RepID=UPI00262FCB4F|nr:M48 family metallopeptidase [Zoogloea sp.]MDD2988722.1 M48 family metallopeptidase [Zoogloea sp.]
MTSPDQGVDALYFDGRSSRARAVKLSLADGELVLRGEDVERHVALAVLRLSEPLGRAPRLITFPDGAHCELPDDDVFRGLLLESGQRNAAVVRWQFSRTAVLVSLLVLVAGLWAVHEWLLPQLARRLAEGVPEALTERLSDETLEMLDVNVFSPSSLPAARQQALTKRVLALAQPDAPAVRPQLAFRRGGRMGANALALPSGLIVVTDELVMLARNDEEILGVLAHELGHVSRRHGLRLAIESSAIGLFAAWYIGDVSALMAGVPAALSQARYSRRFEREADTFAARLMGANGISPAALANILERMEMPASVGQEGGSEAAKPRRTPSDYFSTHPLTEERIRYLRGL